MRRRLHRPKAAPYHDPARSAGPEMIDNEAQPIFFQPIDDPDAATDLRYRLTAVSRSSLTPHRFDLTLRDRADHDLPPGEVSPVAAAGARLTARSSTGWCRRSRSPAERSCSAGIA